MRTARNPTLGALAILLAISLPVAVWASAVNSIYIDESVEGAAPTVTVSAGLVGIATITVSPIFCLGTCIAESWSVDVNLPFRLSSSASANVAANLLEPGSGLVSDDIRYTGFTVTGPDHISLLLDLESDNDTGGIGGICGGSVTCSTQVENGAFQLVGNLGTDSVPPVDVYLKSDLEPSVPEPATLSLLGLGLAGIGMTRRSRRR